MMDDPKSLVAQYEILWAAQANFRSMWQTTAQFVLPAWDNFIGEYAEGVNRNARIFDSTAVTALERFGAAMEAMLTPRSQVWHKMQTDNEDLNKLPEVKMYLEQLNKILFASRYHPEANFASQTDVCYLSLGAFGNDLLFIDQRPGRSLRYRAVPLSECVWATNHQGMVDTVFRKFKYSAKQACDHWGEKALPPVVYKQLKGPNPFEESEYLHVVRPNPEHQPFALGPKGKRFESIYLYLGDKSLIEKGGFFTFPYAIGRYRVAPTENYGRGPAQTCFPDVRTANEMVKMHLRAGAKALDPPVLLAEESLLNNFNQRPGANNFGMVSNDGKPLAVPFKTGGDFEVGEKLLGDTRSTIRDAFLNTLFQILVENPNMTATEALLRAQEKGELIAPAMGRQQSEFLGPLVMREIDILDRAGRLPPKPMAMLESRAGFLLEYTSPLARALRAEEGTAIMNTVADVGTMANLDPSAKLVIDLHEAARTMADIRGCPAHLIRSEEEVTALLEHANDQAAQATQATQAPQVAAGIKNLAQAAQAASQAGAGGAPGAPQIANAA